MNKRDALAVKVAVKDWRERDLIDDGLANALLQTISVLPFDWKKLSKYSFWISIICIITAVSALFGDKYLMAVLNRIFDAPHAIKCLVISLLAAALYRAGLLARARHPERIFSNEAILFLGVATTAAAVYELGMAVDSGSGHFSLLILLSCIIYALLGYWFRSNLIWLFALLSLGGWLGAETGYMSGWGAYYLGMNYPIRFMLFGAVITAVAFSAAKAERFACLRHTTKVMGLLYFFISLWILSIFGNYGDMESWQRVGQIELFHWSILFGIASFAAIWHGLRCDDAVTKGFGLTFLFINLYTRYFEYFWDALHKVVFFAILGASCWLLGRRAERIWNLQNPGHRHAEPRI